MSTSIELIADQCLRYVKGCGFLYAFARNLSHKYKKQLMDVRLGSLKNASKKLLHQTGESLGNKTANTVANSCDKKIVKTKPVEEIFIPP